MIIWSLSCFTLGQVSGMLAGYLRFEPKIAGLEAQLAEREETAAHLWHAYQGAHCRVKELELSVTQHLWPVNSWPEGDEAGIPCETDAAPSPLFDSAEEAGPRREAGGRLMDGDRPVAQLDLRGPGQGLSRNADTPGPSHR